LRPLGETYQGTLCVRDAEGYSLARVQQGQDRVASNVAGYRLQLTRFVISSIALSGSPVSSFIHCGSASIAPPIRLSDSDMLDQHRKKV
jgi:hypothetical protein